MSFLTNHMSPNWRHVRKEWLIFNSRFWYTGIALRKWLSQEPEDRECPQENLSNSSPWLISNLTLKAQTKKVLTKASVARSARTNVFPISKSLPSEKVVSCNIQPECCRLWVNTFWANAVRFTLVSGLELLGGPLPLRVSAPPRFLFPQVLRTWQRGVAKYTVLEVQCYVILGKSLVFSLSGSSFVKWS